MALIEKEIIGKLQERISHEDFNQKTYLAMSYWLNLNGFEGASKLWKEYANDERGHKEWAIKYLLDSNILPIEPAQPQPQTEFKSLPNIIALSYKREVETLKEVRELAELCLEKKDLKTFGLAQKYVDEQIEEISKLQLWIDKLNAFGSEGAALRLLDNEMGCV